MFLRPEYANTKKKKKNHSNAESGEFEGVVTGSTVLRDESGWFYWLAVLLLWPISRSLSHCFQATSCIKYWWWEAVAIYIIPFQATWTRQDTFWKMTEAKTVTRLPPLLFFVFFFGFRQFQGTQTLSQSRWPQNEVSSKNPPAYKFSKSWIMTENNNGSMSFSCGLVRNTSSC